GGARPARARAVRALPRLPDPLRARHERARGDAPHRAALRPGGPPRLPRGGARAARADRARAPRGGRGDDARGSRHRAAPRADPVRDQDPLEAQQGAGYLSPAPSAISPGGVKATAVRGKTPTLARCAAAREIARLS